MNIYLLYRHICTAKTSILRAENVKELILHCVIFVYFGAPWCQHILGPENLTSLPQSFCPRGRRGMSPNWATMFPMFLLGGNTNTSLYKWLHNAQPVHKEGRRVHVCVWWGLAGWNKNTHSFTQKNTWKGGKTNTDNHARQHRQTWKHTNTDASKHK